MAGAAKKKTYNLDEKLIHDARRVLDARTDVYIQALRSDSDRDRFRATFYPLLPTTVLCAVVAY